MLLKILPPDALFADRALDAQLANGIRAIKGIRQEGTRTGNWLTKEQAQEMLNAPDTRTLKGLRDRAILGLLIGCGLRRAEAAGVTFSHIGGPKITHFRHVLGS